MEEKKYVTAQDVINICNGQLALGDANTVLENFSNDTRTINIGDIYIGIKGENFDGNTLYEEALQKGAKACILQNVAIKEEVKQKYADRTIIIVENTMDAIQKIATYKRSLYNIPVVAVTGSVGKTSTKDIIASVMAKKYNVLKTEGNFNNQLGLPLTILKLKDHNAMVVEMGMNQLGEISKLTNIAKPTIAVITNVGTAHIGNLGSRENILRAKLEILEGLQNGGKVVINNDNDLLHKWYEEQKNKENIITFGIENKSDVMAKNAILSEDGSVYDTVIGGKNYKVEIGVGGNHFVLNSLCAIAIGNLLEISTEDILDGILHFELTKRRMQIEKLQNNVVVINDCYNANYDSMKAAIEYLGKIENHKKIVVLGDMLELGEFSERLHRQVGEVVAKEKLDCLICVGEESKYIIDEAIKNGMERQKVIYLNNNDEAILKLKEIMKEGNVSILIKASNGMNFQKIYNGIMN